MEGTKNTFRTIAQPTDFFNLPQTASNAQGVVFEALTSYLLRWTFGSSKESFLKLVGIHALASPMHGGVENMLTTEGTEQKKFTDDASDQFTIALKQLPTVYLCQYVINTPEKGLRFNTKMFDMSDILLTAGAKLITRPILRLLGEPIDIIKKGNTRIDAQRAASVAAAAGSR